MLTAPFDGMLSDVSIGEGRVVSSANPLAVLTDLSSLKVSNSWFRLKFMPKAHR